MDSADPEEAPMMFTVLFLCGFVLALVFRNRQRVFELRRETKRLAYYFVENSLVFLTCFLLVGVFYQILLLVVWSSDYVSIGFLLSLEQNLNRIRGIVAPLQSATTVLAVLCALYLAGFLRMPWLNSRRFSSGFG